ncbi:MAG: MBL fold metallo-hydrolase [Kurthia sp.]|nr:MBL fold metallo-hydrolase [Candidatus Kurthia equi]
MKQYKYFALALVVIIVIIVSLLSDPASESPTSIGPTATSSDTEVNKNLVQADGDVKVHMIDIGQGDSLLIQSNKDTILIDGGNKGKGDEVLDYLEKNNVTKLTAVISTHPDADHIGGLAEIIRGIPVQAVYAPRVTHTTEAYKQFLLSVKERALKIKIAKNGVQIPTKTAGLSLDFIGPTKEYSQSDLNDWSAVLKMTHGTKKFLFTGDAETPAEKDMLAFNLLEPVDVLKVSHHGAAEASNTDYLQKLQPKLAGISVGKGNRYDHPTTETLKRLKKVGATIYRTDQHGHIVFISNGKNIIVKVER